MRTGAEIKLALAAFVKRWSGYGGTERAEAQTFLNDLFACYGADRKDVGAADDDYSMGILLSRAHDAWAWARSSTLETRLRYTPSSAFETFPFPDPGSPDVRAKVAAASAALYARRTALCAEHQVGLTRLYNLMDEGAFTDLKALQLELDRAVVAAHGWPESIAQDGAELVRLLTERNKEIAKGPRPYAPF